MNIEKLKEIRRQVVELDGDINPKFRMKQLLDALIEQPKEKWEPKENETFYYVSEYGSTKGSPYSKCNYLYLKDFGNCFKTEEEAEQVKDKIKELLNK